MIENHLDIKCTTIRFPTVSFTRMVSIESIETTTTIHTIQILHNKYKSLRKTILLCSTIGIPPGNPFVPSGNRLVPPGDQTVVNHQPEPRQPAPENRSLSSDPPDTCNQSRKIDRFLRILQIKLRKRRLLTTFGDYPRKIDCFLRILESCWSFRPVESADDDKYFFGIK